MQVAVIFVALVALAGASDVHVATSDIHHEVPFVGSTLGSFQTTYANQPVVVVRKTTYYEPELVAVVVEKGVDDIPEETYLIQNYADVLGASNHEIHLCGVHDDKDCLDKPVTKLLVPSLFKSIGQSGFENFFENAKEVPWVSTINDNVELVKPVITPKTSTINEASLRIVSPDVFRYISDMDYRNYPVVSPNILRTQVSVPISHEIPQTRVISEVPQTRLISEVPQTRLISEVPQTRLISEVPQTRVISDPNVLPSNLAAGFAPLDHITTGGSFLGGAATLRTAYHPNVNTYPHVNYRQRRHFW